jgi:hypothetical protein
MPPVEWEGREDLDAVYMPALQGWTKLFQLRSRSAFHAEHALPALSHQRCSAAAGHGPDRTLDFQGINFSAGVLDAGCAPAQQPQSLLSIHIAGVTGPMPDRGAGAQLTPGVVPRIEVAAQDVLAADDNFPRRARRNAQGLKLRQGKRAGSLTFGLWKNAGSQAGADSSGQ